MRARAARRAAALLTRLRSSNADTDRVAALVRAGPSLPGPDAEGAVRRRWPARVGAERVPDLARLTGARARVRDAGRTTGTGVGSAAKAVARSVRGLRRELRADPPLTVGDLALDGGDLIRMGLKPGPRFGEILDALLDRVIVEPGLNRREALAELVRTEVAPEAFEGAAGREGDEGAGPGDDGGGPGAGDGAGRSEGSPAREARDER